MAITVSDDLTTLDDLNDGVATGIFGNLAAGGTDTAILVQGTGAGRFRVNTTGDGAIYYDSGAANLDFSGGAHLFMWAQTLDNVAASGGWRMRFSSAANAQSNYFLADVGNTVNPAVRVSGYINFCSSPSANVTTSGTPPSVSGVRSVALVANHTTASTRETIFFDEIKMGTGITVTGGTTAAPADSNQIVNDATTGDIAQGRGLFKDAGGVYFILGRVTIGDTTNGNTFVFRDSGETWIFEDQNVTDSFHKIEFVSNATGTTREQTFGSLVGTGITAVGVNGNVFKAAGAHPFQVVATDSNINDLNLYGCSFLNGSNSGGTVKFQSTRIECVSCLFSSCDTVTVTNAATLRKAVITDSTSGSTSGALDLGDTDPPTDTVRDIQIQNSTNALYLHGTSTGTTTYNLRNFTFAGNTNKIRLDFPGAATIVINVLDGGDSITTGDVVNVNSSSLTINVSVPVTVTVVDKNDTPIQTAQVAVYVGATQVINADTNASGVASGTWSGATPSNAVWKVRKSSTGATKYVSASGPSVIAASSGMSVKVVLQEDANVDL